MDQVDACAPTPKPASLGGAATSSQVFLLHFLDLMPEPVLKPEVPGFLEESPVHVDGHAEGGGFVGGLGQDDVEQVQGFEGVSVLESGPCSLGQGLGATGQIDEVGVDGTGGNPVEFCGGFMVEPTAVGFPDGTDAPGYAAIAFPTSISGGILISRIKVWTSCPAFIPATVSSWTWWMASRYAISSSWITAAPTTGA